MSGRNGLRSKDAEREGQEGRQAKGEEFGRRRTRRKRSKRELEVRPKIQIFTFQLEWWCLSMLKRWEIARESVAYASSCLLCSTCVAQALPNTYLFLN